MGKKPYIFIIDVTGKSPKGVKMLNSTLRGVGVADVPNAKAVLEGKAIEQVKMAYLEKYPGVPMQFTAKSHRIDQDFLIVEGLDVEPETGADSDADPEASAESE